MLWYFNICYVSFLCLLLGFLFCIFLSMSLIFMDQVIFIEWELFMINGSCVVMTMLIDWMSMMFLGFVMFISSMVIFYSSDYMLMDKDINRFILLVLMFVFSMGLLIISPNLISILLGWDGLGLVSYCLVIYYQNIKSYNAGMLTALSNRVGDVAILMSIAWMLNFGSWNFFFYVEYTKDFFEMLLISGFVVLAGMTKSAQIPFSAWLPAAMAAPTPVSSLVHSSTLVTAGVYLLIRFSPLISMYFWWFLFYLSVLTMFMAGVGANFEFDLKKIIALSTLSQLGVMMSILSIGYPLLAFFHLLTHAIFKALLFLCAGAIIHSVSDWQDIRSLGSIIGSMPLTVCCFNIANLALCGMPFLAGFYSKDLILEMLEMNNINLLMFMLCFISTGLTVCYSFRLLYYSMMSVYGINGSYCMSDEENMSVSLLVLGVAAIMSGSMLSWIIFFKSDLICMPLYLKLLTLFVCGVGAWVGLEINLMNTTENLYYYEYGVLSSFLGSMWFMPFLSVYSTKIMSLIVGAIYVESVDYGWSEYFGGQGIYSNLKKYSGFLYELQGNEVMLYLMTFFLWIFVVMYIIIFI
uniref:NADH-ubiquinone oxidoreductase chain 5 n=1 Tax=Trigoniophthalmus alternatus TaxID=50637 RepID=B2BSA6_9INSE|nr:NADH dehydrogenase subunit 5 [Trigoniophthalmus alternatus]ABS57559.1 NADH dehydrogenase subunit 5 [Trigoniophthalmus alternatus]